MKTLITIVLLTVSLSVSAYDWNEVQDRRDYDQHRAAERQYWQDERDHNQQLEYEIRRERIEEQHDNSFQGLCDDNPYC